MLFANLVILFHSFMITALMEKGERGIKMECKVCCCVLSGTEACKHCTNSGAYTVSTTTYDPLHKDFTDLTTNSIKVDTKTYDPTEELIDWDAYNPHPPIPQHYEKTNIACPKCKTALLKRTDIILTSYPPQMQYECPNCGFVGYKFG